MHRIDTINASATLPAPTVPGPKPNGYFSHGQVGNEDTLIYPTKVDAEFFNASQEELCKVIEMTGAALNKSNNHQLRDAIQVLINENSTGSGVGIPDVEADPNPTLGGNLITNSKKIFSNDAVIFDTDTIDFQAAEIDATIQGLKISNSETGEGSYLGFGDVDGGYQFAIDDTEILLGVSRGIRISTAAVAFPDQNEIFLFSDSGAMADTNSLNTAYTQRAGKEYIDTNIPNGDRYLTALFQTIDTPTYYPTVDSGSPITLMCEELPVIMAKDATLRNLRVVSTVAVTAALTITVRKNGTNTALTVTTPSSGTFDVSDTTHTASFVAGDTIDVVISTSGFGIRVAYMDISVQGV